MIQPHILAKDESGHWYLIPEDQEDRFIKWVEATENDADWEGEGYDANRIDGPRSIRIIDWETR